MKFNLNNKKVLVLKLQGIGDTIMMLPMIRELVEVYPDIKLDVAVLSNGSDELLKLIDIKINNIYTIKNNLKSYFKFLILFIFKHYYMIILPYKSGRKENLLSFFSFSKYSVGYAFKKVWKEYFYQLFDFLIKIKLTPFLNNHYTYQGLKIVEFLSGKLFPDITNYNIKFNITLKNRKRKKYIILHLGAGDKERLWDIDNFVKLSEKILNHYSDINIVLIGKGYDTFLNKKFLSRIENKFRKKIKVEEDLNLVKLFSVIRNGELIIGNDSGIMHIASLFNKKILSIWGYTNFYHTSPIGNNTYIIRRELTCSPCYRVFLPVKCRYNRKICMDISVDEVFQIFNKIYNNKNIKGIKLNTGANIINL